MYESTYKMYGNKTQMKNTQDDYANKEMWSKRRHKKTTLHMLHM